MSNMAIYAALSAIGGNIESVYGTKMRVRVIDSSDKDAVEQAKADGWLSKAEDVIEQIETQKLEVENEVMKGELSGDNSERIDELEGQLSTALEEIAGFEQERTESNKVIDEKIARIADVESKLEKSDTWNNEVTAQNELHRETIRELRAKLEICYEELTIPQLSTLLKKRDVEHNVRDGKDALVKLATDSEN